jgi:Raf kinase inhibitor-like YbhB/YbcL family protein
MFVAIACSTGTVLPTEATEMAFQLTSDSFTEGGQIPVRHTCDGENRPPVFRWQDAPDETTELALVFDDPDARGFVHWLVVGIPPSASSVGEGGLPAGARQGRNDFGDAGYGGPCPPSGTHRYVATLYALSGAVDLPDNPTGADLQADVEGKVLGEARLTGRYTRH